MSLVTSSLKPSSVWKGEHHSIHFSIVHWGYGDRYNNNGQGVWNYYIVIHENNSPCFDTLWLPDKVEQWTTDGPYHLTHDYSSSPLARADWHGGITFYQKHNHFVCGQRYVEAGCDYNHLADQNRIYNLEHIHADVIRCIDSMFDLGLVKQSYKTI